MSETRSASESSSARAAYAAAAKQRIDGLSQSERNALLASYWRVERDTDRMLAYR